MNVRILLLLVLVNAGPASAADNIEAGKKLFAMSCSVGYCHGAEGRAGRGPRLRDREWDRNYLFKVIDEGIPNSSMPAWHGKLTTDQMKSVVSYILSISKEITRPDAAPKQTVAISTPSSTASGGKSLFFDPTNDRNCGVCHKFAGSGGEIGPDLSRIGSQPAREIVKRMLTSRGTAVEVVLKDGETIRGVIAAENAAGVRVYDLTSSGPPVARTLSPGDFAGRRRIEANIVHEHVADGYTIQQLLDLVSYLKSTTVRLEDVF
ncbi:MAG TPA: c-type cytochrome [Bryobacteraceae bacterium]|jgi:putative heme-binding domain-containing protein